ncbi:MAG TPA: type II secretion system F family protein [Vulgatibacter sp.]|nr:type II secretion system F family protein [Vulgatibacter sp.]
MNAWANALAALLAAGAVFLFARMATGIVAQASRRLEDRYTVRSAQELRDILLFVDGRSLAVLGACAGALLFGCGLLAGAGLAATLAGVAGAAAPGWIVRRYRARRIASFERQLVDALQAMSSAFRAGLTFPQALASLAREAPFPLGPELAQVVKELKLGVPTEVALDNLASRVDSADLALVVTSTNTARELGGNLAEMFETLAATIRERFRLQGRIAALTSQGRMQGRVVAALPVLLGLAMRWIRPDLVDPMLDHPFGWILVALVVALELAGMLLIRRIVTVDV